MSKTDKIGQTKRALIEALEKSLGIVTTACKIVGCSRQTFYSYYEQDEQFARAVRDIDEIVLDFAESQLHKQIKEDNTTATIFYLKTKGKKRGYIERIENEHIGAQKIIIEEEIIGDTENTDSLD